MTLFLLSGIGVVCFNTRLGFLDPELSSKPDAMEYLKASKSVFRLLHQEISGGSILHGLYRNKTYRNFEAVQLKLKHYSGKELQKASQKLKEKQQNGTFDTEEPNLLFSLLSDPKIDLDDISNLMNSLYVGGTDSTAKSLQIFFYNLAMNPEKQEILYQEINEVLGPDQPLTPEALAQMPYLKAAIKESFRMMFPNLGISRFMPKDVVLSGYHVPEGTQVLICSSSVSKACFDNHDQYIPERWLRTEQGKRSDSTIHPMSVLPFGYGPRNCIGRRFAEQEMFLATVKVLQKLKIGLKPRSEGVQFIYSIFLEPEKPIAFIFSKR
ncbi:cholesterol side-chain cleavage enzyme, mitochondrial [Elysia marginata]|uniref:Cholesterol side-chain cleavage enzyme, mitochondrial n=1 Tax=Elysia marginata TaxID=1093978 RepID=A0AAV4GDI3_9GAST|nr:cholesterol side-chain cleavage enzyme, mitochondrial [Elysia marginata]